MKKASTDTIAAIATPPGRGGIGIVRVSGPLVTKIATAILGCVPAPRIARLGDFVDSDGLIVDSGLALYFPAPHSFTGEDVLELQGHGGPVVLDMLLAECLALGARAARPGEFSERAFLNDKLDLLQAEAIADLIDSTSTRAARLALRSLQGEFSKRVHELVESVTRLRMYVESAIDFPEEEIDFLADGEILAKLKDLRSQLENTLQSAQQGNLIREGIQVVIAGLPNAGKSTLLNALAGRESAIVTDIPGTTRDVLREYIQVDGLPLHIIDTAGLRDSADSVEQEGIRRAWKEIENADRILWIKDASNPVSAEDKLYKRLAELGPEITVVNNKIDVLKTNPRCDETTEPNQIDLSAQTGAGLDLLREHLGRCAGYQQNEEGQFLARRRHLDALERAGTFLQHGLDQLESHAAGELLAEELRQAQLALGEITGEISSDELLGRIFASFCIGK